MKHWIVLLVIATLATAATPIDASHEGICIDEDTCAPDGPGIRTCQIGFMVTWDEEPVAGLCCKPEGPDFKCERP